MPYEILNLYFRGQFARLGNSGVGKSLGVSTGGSTIWERLGVRGFGCR